MPRPLDPAAPALPRDPALLNPDELVRQCLPLVNHLVRDVQKRVPAHVNRDDLASAAMYALALAARSFDPSRGVPFTNYAALRMRGALIDELRAVDWASRDSRRRAREIETTSDGLIQRLGRRPSCAEVAEAMGVSTTELSTFRAQAERANVLSLQATAPGENERALAAPQEGPEGLLLRREELGYLRDAIAELPERLRIVVEEYYFGQRKMTDIAADLGVTESRISQLRSQALGMLRVAMQAAGDEEPAVEPQSTKNSKRSGACAARMRASVAARSTVAERLSATTLLGERRPALAGSSSRAAT